MIISPSIFSKRIVEKSYPYYCNKCSDKIEEKSIALIMNNKYYHPYCVIKYIKQVIKLKEDTNEDEKKFIKYLKEKTKRRKKYIVTKRKQIKKIFKMFPECIGNEI